MDKKILARVITCIIAAVVILSLDLFTPVQAKVLGLTMKGMTLILLGFALFYVIKAIRTRQ